MRLLCFSYAGGLASAFFPWTRASFPQIRPVEYPGRGSRWNEPLCRTMPSLIDNLIDDIHAELSTPYALLGHSFGGLVVFHLAHRLKDLGLALPAKLIISAARPPHIRYEERIHDAPPEVVLSKVAEWGGIPQAVLESQELLDLLLPVVRADFTIVENTDHAAAAPLPVPMTVLCGRDDPKVKQTHALAWQQYTTKSFRCRIFPGSHFFLFSPEFSLDIVAEECAPPQAVSLKGMPS